MINQKEILLKVIDSISQKLISAENELTQLDSIGDADCGSGVRRGFEAVQKIYSELANLKIDEILKKVGFTLAYTIGGTSGAMLGTGFIETGKAIQDIQEPKVSDWIGAIESALQVIKRRGGGTKVGDKTLVDALEPAVETMKTLLNNLGWQEKIDIDKNAVALIINNDVDVSSNINSETKINITTFIDAAYMAAKFGSDKTIDMVAKKGRASYLGQRSRGNRDPGSLIIVLMFEAALEVLKSLI